MGTGNVGRQFRGRTGLSEKGVIALVGNVDHTDLSCAAMLKYQVHLPLLVAILFPLIEVLEYFVPDQVGHTTTEYVRGRDQGDHSSGRVGSSPVVM
jgi:hypothetical protein